MSAGWPRAVERSQQLGEVQQTSSVASSAMLLCLAHGVTKPREVVTMWCSGSRTESCYPCCPHRLKSYQGRGPVGSTTKNQGQSNPRGQNELAVSDNFWLLPVPFCNRHLYQLANSPGFWGKNVPTLSS